MGLELEAGEEYVGNDVNEDEGFEVEYVVDRGEVIDETVEINVDCCSEVENEVIVVDVVTLVVIEPKQDILSIKKTKSLA